MKRYLIPVLVVVVGSAATAIASIAPANTSLAPTANVTVVAKNSPFPVIGPLVVEPCATENCSE